MAERTVAHRPGDTSSSGSKASAVEPLARCCPSHPDWPTLSNHLRVDFPELSTEEVVTEVARARDAVSMAALGGRDALGIGEIIARHQLLLLAGRVEDIARLDPERHVRARPPR